MKVLIAIDSFKGSMSSVEAGESAKAGILRVFEDANIEVRPLADGGEGTVEAIVSACQGRIVDVNVTGPAGKPVNCSYGIVDKTHTGIIEMSGAAGITQVSGKEKNPLYTTTFGVGEVIKDAIEKGCRHFVVGIGGSATNDGGVGMLQALGFDFLDEKGQAIQRGAIGLKDLKTIGRENVLPELNDCTFRIACDVTNPLCGEKGASAIYGPQKGATKDMIKDMDQWLLDYAILAKQSYSEADENYPGAGAAGGMGFAFLTFLGGSLESGIKIVLEETNLRAYAESADLVITGEGRLDGQTVMGKAPIGVAKLAKEYKLPVLGFSGCVTQEAVACNGEGIDAFFPILRTVTSLEEALEPTNAMKNMSDTVEQVFRTIKTLKKIIN